LDCGDFLHCRLDVGEDDQEAVTFDAEAGAAEDLDVGAAPRQVAGREPVVVASRREAPALFEDQIPGGANRLGDWRL
jgi:hypothetical protein